MPLMQVQAKKPICFEMIQFRSVGEYTLHDCRIVISVIQSVQIEEFDRWEKYV